MAIMPSVPGGGSLSEDRGVLRSLLSALAFDNHSPFRSSRRGSLTKRLKKRRKHKRRDCLGRSVQEDDTVDENESTTEIVCQLDSTLLDQYEHEMYLVDPSFVDIFYNAKDRLSVEACMDEDLIPIGLEPDDLVMLESFEVCRRGDGIASINSSCDHSTIRHYQVPLECEVNGRSSLSASCSTLTLNEATSKQQAQQPSIPKKDCKDDVPVRFLRAEKGDSVAGRRRFIETLEWRKENDIDNALHKAWPKFELVKQHYPHYFHGIGRKGQPVFYEQPPKTDLRALRNAGVELEDLLKHYAMVCEFQWQYISRDDFQQSLYVIDLAGIRISDFVGDVVEFVRQASAFTAAHYPERSGLIFIVNVPVFFKVIWNVVKPMVDDVTLEKVHILRGKEEAFQALLKHIPVEEIPQEYGGQSCHKLGNSPQEKLLRSVMTHNNEMAQGQACRFAVDGKSCRFCNFACARYY